MNSTLKKLACLAILSAPLAAHAGTTACRVPSFPQEVQCGQIERPLDPSQANGKTITVHYVVLPSQDRNKLPDAVFLLAGGPGQSATGAASFGESMLGKLNRRRDLVFVDQRGTGKSASLQCPKIENEEGAMDQAQVVKRMVECRDALQKLPHGDMRFYTTSIAVQDLEAVRQAQNYGPINLVGVSYGTRVGLEYLRQYPQSVRRLVIDGVVPPDLSLLGADAKAALQGVFDDCKTNARCNQAYPDLEGRWKHLLNSMPKQAQFIHPRLGTDTSEKVTRDDVIGMVFRGLYSPTMTSLLPYAITQADQGKFAPLMNLAGGFNLPSPMSMSMGMHYSVWCSEGYAKPPAVDANDEIVNVMHSNYAKICAEWPKGKVPAEFYTIPKSDRPVLLLSGGIDPVTPTKNGELVAKALGDKARHVFIANAGHGVLGQGCVREVVNNFFAAKTDQEAVKVDASCVAQIPRPTVWLPPKSNTKAKSNEGSAP